MLAVIGSVALQKHGINLRAPKDTDLVGLKHFVEGYMLAKGGIPEVINNGKTLVAFTDDMIYEAELVRQDTTSEDLLALIANDDYSIVEYDENQTLYYAHMDIVYLLKMTHRYKKNSKHFYKTMKDIHALRELGAVIRSEHQEFYEQRLKETLFYGHPKLNQTKKDFFTDTVPYKYDHDSIHEAIKLFDKPAYSYFKKDESEVMVDKDMFFALPFEKQIAATYEESCVLALERSQIPYPHIDKKRSFLMALEKVCTSITSGWFREFSWEHFQHAVRLYDQLTSRDCNYLDQFNKGLAAGVVKPFEGKSND